MVIAKADSLGSLEALIFLLRKSQIQISKVGIGDVNKKDVISAYPNLEKAPLDGVVVGFNVKVSEEVKLEHEKVKILTNEVIYKLIEDLEAWREEKAKELLRKKLEVLTMPCKLKVLKFVFRQSHPAIFGVKIEAGSLKSEMPLMNNMGEKLAEVKAIQAERKGVKEAKKGQEVAISLPGITFGRQVKEDETLYSALSESEFRKLKDNKSLLSGDELSVLQEISQIKRREKSTWGL